MKLDSLERDDLRQGLRRHPDVGQHVARPDAIARMPTGALLSLAKKLTVDPKALIQEVKQRRAALQAYSEKFPAFEDTFDFDLTVELLGKRITRKARVQYSHTPEWEYWDIWKEAPYVGWPMAALGVSFLTDSDKDGTLGDPDWEEVPGILNIGEVWTVIDDEIEERCKAEDARRRRKVTRDRRSRGLNGPG